MLTSDELKKEGFIDGAEWVLGDYHIGDISKFPKDMPLSEVMKRIDTGFDKISLGNNGD